jgi:hypothetical protein
MSNENFDVVFDKKKRKLNLSKGAIIALVLIIALVVGGIIIYFVFFSSPSNLLTDASVEDKSDEDCSITGDKADNSISLIDNSSSGKAKALISGFDSLEKWTIGADLGFRAGDIGNSFSLIALNEDGDTIAKVDFVDNKVYVGSNAVDEDAGYDEISEDEMSPYYIKITADKDGFTVKDNEFDFTNDGKLAKISLETNDSDTDYEVMFDLTLSES